MNAETGKRKAGKEQPLNVEIGKREADEMFRRRDRNSTPRFSVEHNVSELDDWVGEEFPDGFPADWFSGNEAE